MCEITTPVLLIGVFLLHTTPSLTGEIIILGRCLNMYEKKLLKITSLFIVFILSMFMITACGQSPEDTNNTNTEQKNVNEIDLKDNNAKPDADKDENEAGAYPMEIVDTLGRKVVIEKQPERIISLAPSNTEILFALGLGEKVVGVTDFCDFPEEAKSKEKVGDFTKPNMEKIISLEPDIVLGGNGLQHETIEKLEQSGIVVAATEGTNFDEVYKSIIDVGKITGTMEKAQQIVDDAKQKEEDIKSKVSAKAKPKCYFVLSYGQAGNWTAGPGSFIDEMITKAGGENIASDTGKPWAEYSIEKLVEKNPDVILLSAMAGSKADVAKEQGYKDTKAVKEDKIVVVDDNKVSRPGPRLIEGLEEVARAIHPELFK